MENGTSAIFNRQTKPIADALVQIINHDLTPYWPVTVRQCFYQLVGRMIVPNSQDQYRTVSRVLVKLRENDLVPWDAIEDRTRRTTHKRGVSNVVSWLEEQCQDMLRPDYYGRCLVQNQPVYCEVSTEKDALSSILESVVWPYCVRLNVVRGQVSATMVHQIALRFEQAMMNGQRPLLLHFGDLDPSGVSIPHALKRNLIERHGIDVEVVRVALNPEQVAAYHLPVSLDAVKTSDPNHGAWLRKYGESQPAVELDALHPQDLQDILRDALDQVFDMQDFQKQKRQEVQDRELVKEIRLYVLGCIGRRFGDQIPYCKSYSGVLGECPPHITNP